MKTVYRKTYALLIIGLCFYSMPGVSKSLRINGIALYQELNETYYYGALSIQTPSDNPNVLLLDVEPRRMELRVATRKISPRRFYKMWNESIAINNPPNVIESFSKEIQQFVHLLKGDLLEGDRVIIDSEGRKFPVIVSVNGVTLLTLNNSDFFNVLLNTWLGEVPPNREFKEDILGVNLDRQGMLKTHFKGILAKSGRTEAIQAWVKLPAPIQHASPSISKAVQSKDETPDSQIDRSNAKMTPSDPPKSIAKPAKIQNENEYYYALVDWASRHSNYPEKAIEQRMEGVVRLKVTIDRSGKVTKYVFLQKSDYDLLNNTAVQAIGKATPFPPMPSTLKGDQYQFAVPFKYQLEQP